MEITIKLPSSEITRTVPDSWNDCPLEIAMVLLEILQLDGPNITQKRISALQALLQIRMEEWVEWEMLYVRAHGLADGRLMFAADIEALLEHIPWLLDKAPTGEQDEFGQPRYQYSLSASLTKCPFPAITVAATPSFPHSKGKTVVLHAPADELSNISGEELAHAFTAYERYAADPSERNCNLLLAMLWRKSKVETEDQLENNWYGDRRQPFNPHNVEVRANQIQASVHKMAKNLMLFWFLSCRMKMIKDWPVIFKAADEVRRDPNAPDFSWWGVYMSLLDDPLRVDEFAKKPYTDLFTTIAWYDAKAKEEEMRRAMASV